MYLYTKILHLCVNALQFNSYNFRSGLIFIILIFIIEQDYKFACILSDSAYLALCSISFD